MGVKCNGPVYQFELKRERKSGDYHNYYNNLNLVLVNFNIQLLHKPLPRYDEDDSYCSITLPFSVQIYSQQSPTTYMSTNGFISIVNGSSQYQPAALPDAHIPNNTVAPFFDDLYLYGNSNPQQGIFYQLSAAGTNVTYEYYIGRGARLSEIFHFTIDYNSLMPGVFVYTYYLAGNTTDDGISASIGTQGINSAGTEVASQYSLRSAGIFPGLIVTCDTTANTCVTTHPGAAP
ncbi:hypothetical protein LTR65_006308 [Meristemomyces frigidus]